jgi:hypothetical protein
VFDRAMDMRHRAVGRPLQHPTWVDQYQVKLVEVLPVVGASYSIPASRGARGAGASAEFRDLADPTTQRTNPELGFGGPRIKLSEVNAKVRRLTRSNPERPAGQRFE